MSFDRIAPHYRLLETIAFGRALQRSRICWVENVPRPQRALILGEGNGRFLCELLRIHAKIDIDCVDASERMLQLARARVRRLHPESLGRIQFLHRDILKWSPSGGYDFFVTHFFLDCFRPDEVKAIVRKLARVAQPQALWLIADFTIPAERLARLQARLWLRLMYAFFQLSTQITARDLVDPAPYLRANGFVRNAQKCYRTGMLSSEVYLRSP